MTALDDDGDLITVCDRCGYASCWQGEFMCDAAQFAGTKQVTRGELKRLRAEGKILEHPSYWRKD